LIEEHRDDLGEVLFRRARHARSEHRRVMAARDALAEGDLHRLGALLNASHASLRDDYEVSCGEVDVLVHMAQSHPHVLGARMVGGGFGGCTVNLVKRENADIVVREVCEAYGALMGRPSWHHVVGETGPAGEVTA
jgi:galactokinase